VVLEAPSSAGFSVFFKASSVSEKALALGVSVNRGNSSSTPLLAGKQSGLRLKLCPMELLVLIVVVILVVAFLILALLTTEIALEGGLVGLAINSVVGVLLLFLANLFLSPPIPINIITILICAIGGVVGWLIILGFYLLRIAFYGPAIALFA
jgi:hypothetical protein